VNDQYGDGFNNGFGAGNYSIKAGTLPIVTMNGVMGLQSLKLFRTSMFTGINEKNSSIIDINVFPNPTKNNSVINLDLIQNESVSISVINVVGQNMFTQFLTDLPAGKHQVNLNTENWANGIYNISIATPNGNTTRKLIVSK
jgi:hypothetical protein